MWVFRVQSQFWEIWVVMIYVKKNKTFIEVMNNMQIFMTVFSGFQIVIVKLYALKHHAN